MGALRSDLPVDLASRRIEPGWGYPHGFTAHAGDATNPGGFRTIGCPKATLPYREAVEDHLMALGRRWIGSATAPRPAAIAVDLLPGHPALTCITRLTSDSADPAGRPGNYRALALLVATAWVRRFQGDVDSLLACVGPTWSHPVGATVDSVTNWRPLPLEPAQPAALLRLSTLAALATPAALASLGAALLEQTVHGTPLRVVGGPATTWSELAFALRLAPLTVPRRYEAVLAEGAYGRHRC